MHTGWADPALDLAIFEPAGGHPKEVRGRENHGQLQVPHVSPLEGAIGCHRCELPGPLNFPVGPTPEPREGVRIDQYTDARGCDAGPCTDGWYQLLPHIFARLPRGFVRSTHFSGRGLSLPSRLYEKLMGEVLAELATPPILAFPN